MFQWRVNLLEELRNAGWNTTRIRAERVLGQSTLQKMRRGQLLSWGELDKYCQLTGKQPGDLIEWVPDESQEEPIVEEDCSEWYKPNYE